MPPPPNTHTNLCKGKKKKCHMPPCFQPALVWSWALLCQQQLQGTGESTKKKTGSDVTHRLPWFTVVSSHFSPLQLPPTDTGELDHVTRLEQAEMSIYIFFAQVSIGVKKEGRGMFKTSRGLAGIHFNNSSIHICLMAFFNILKASRVSPEISSLSCWVCYNYLHAP